MAKASRKKQPKPPLTEEQVLEWADAHFKKTGKWPTVKSGQVLGAPEETWRNIYSAMYHGLRGFPGGSSVAQLLAEHRGVRNRMARPRLTKKQILAWADSHRRATGRWPTQSSGVVTEAHDEDWKNIDRALRRGDRGLSGDDSLAQLISWHRGVRHRGRMPPLRIQQILHWADVHYRRYRQWPNARSGKVVSAIHEEWGKIDVALKEGLRRLPRGGSLAKLLYEHRGVRNKAFLPPLTVEQILQWADAHFEHTGTWPREDSGSVTEAPHENWRALSQDLRQGHRGLPGGSSLAQLLESERDYRNPANRPRLTLKQILAWADDHRARTGKWPTHLSGRVLAEPSETWGGIHAALVNKLRGIRRRSSLARLLADRRGYQHVGNRPRLTIKQILAWADAHQQRTGTWPNRSSGEIVDAPGETWSQVSQALERGLRGLPGGSSLAKLLAARRGYRNPKELPDLTVAQILKWADKHKKRTGRWPNARSGPVVDAPGETWANIQNALWRGGRGLPEGLTVKQVLAIHRGVRNPGCLPTLTERKVIAWARAYHRRNGRWPSRYSGEIEQAPGETWLNIDQSLRMGLRGFAGGSSLPQLLTKACGKPNPKALPKLRVTDILKWADAYFEKTGRWPGQNSGPVDGVDGLTWRAVRIALSQGLRGLPGNDSIVKLLKRHGRISSLHWW